MDRLPAKRVLRNRRSRWRWAVLLEEQRAEQPAEGAENDTSKQHEDEAEQRADDAESASLLHGLDHRPQLGRYVPGRRAQALHPRSLHGAEDQADRDADDE